MEPCRLMKVKIDFGWSYFHLFYHIVVVPYSVHDNVSFIQAISIAPLQVHYYTEALPTQHRYYVEVSLRSTAGNCKWRTCPRSLRGARPGFEPATLRTKGDEFTNEPPRPPVHVGCILAPTMGNLLWMTFTVDVIMIFVATFATESAVEKHKERLYPKCLNCKKPSYSQKFKKMTGNLLLPWNLVSPPNKGGRLITILCGHLIYLICK